MIDIVIPYKATHTPELFYAIASARKYLSGIKNIYVIGDDPNLPGTIHIPFIDSPKTRQKEKNCWQKMILACNMPEVSDPFLRMHDDHFILSPFIASQFPNYYKCTLRQSSAQLRGNNYRFNIHNTYMALKARHHSLLNFDTHCPMLFNKEQFITATSQYDWNRPYGFLLKSLYANTLSLPGVMYPDCKVDEYDAKLEDRLFFSTGGWSESIEGWLKKKYCLEV